MRAALLLEESHYIGHGVFHFNNNLTGEVYTAVFQKIGDVVGAQCGAQIMKNLVLFTEGSVENLAKFCPIWLR